MAARHLGLPTLFAFICSSFTLGAAAQTPPPVPTAKHVVTTAAPPPAPSPAAAPAAPPDTVERARRGVVVLERQGKPLALGFVLDGDGRILTALSPLTSGNFVSARYHDGTVLPLKLVHGDRGWDLALLAVSGTHAQLTKKAGLKAAKTPSFVGLQTFKPAPGAVAAAPAALQLSGGLLGGDGAALREAYELDSKPALVGAPIVNGAGEVVALVARACPPARGAGCVPSPYGAPVAALKQFLQKVPAEATWLGVELVGDESQGVRGLRVAAVTPGSPAAAAGLRPGKDGAQADLVVAVDGLPVASLTDLNEAVRSRAAGDDVLLLLYGLGRYRQVSVKPLPAPELIQPPYVAPKPGKPHTPNPYR